ncbi:MAG: von Willebrand factor type A domain-containing protein [Candidatus Edwardsbacteria bacterium]|nr:von Willebrand factor type A domain-containing protein [Candidatus Edwardsbacteria bacterium]MBU1577376.1 von Willebrand factor type A domain-containing protein [Candidatus Edwardsbacteria bacterium]MBU2463184.1 von Willebrand factor type A domain-containing protein [Candidatus Edwardsbacteria bacterium]MBU2594155.1 von Willebrand factor type A domain-containing protein [Candidatus Edwardsbacteria bacterium]
MKNRIFPLIAAAVLALISASLIGAAGTGVINCIVMDNANNNLLTGVTLRIPGTSYVAVGDKAGHYQFTGLPEGTYTVEASLAGYQTMIKKNVKVKTNQIVKLAFKLKAHQKKGLLQRLGLTKDEKKYISPPCAMVACKMVAAECDQMGGYSLPADFNTEEYSRIYENRFLEVVQNPLSTFSIDVDPASYANVRRFLNYGQMPPKDAVRIEEMINYFDYDYPLPDDGRPFSVITDASPCPWNNGHRLVRIGIKGKEIPRDKLPPTNLVFLIDVSGSMQSPDKLPLLKSAFKMLVNQLRPADRIAIAVYASSEGLALPSTSGKNKKAILDVLDKLEAGGCTAGAAGIQLAYRTAKENFIKGGNNRVILATDGDFNVGVSSTSELIRMIEQKREEGIFLSVLGFGSGNLKDSRMEQLADKGNGNYAYIDNITEAKKVLVNQMAGTLFTIAKDVKIQVEFNPARVKAYKLIGYENRMLNKEDFNDDKKDAGELGVGHTVTALYELVPAGSKEKISKVDDLKYQKVTPKPNSNFSGELMTVKLRYKDPDGNKSRLITKAIYDDKAEMAKMPEDLRFASAVAEFGLLLRDSEHKGNSSYRQVLELARSSRGNDTEGYRAEFIKLVEAASQLAVKQD